VKVSALNVYPLKSARGISVNVMRLDLFGVRHDRRWMLIDDDARFISQREKSRLALIVTALDDDQLTVCAPDRPPFRVPRADVTAPRMKATIWEDVVDVIPVGGDADAWFSDALETRCRVVYFPDDSTRVADRVYNPEGRLVALTDGFPMLLISESSLAALNERLSGRDREPIPMNRFRPNLVVGDAPAFAEDAWKEIQVGGEEGIRISIVKPCARCSITTVDQATGTRGKEPLETLATFRRGKEGSVLMAQNAIHDRAGTMRLGDDVRVVR
jgi:MOSC domain-containing protein